MLLWLICAFYLIFMNLALDWHGGYEYVHHDKVADASAHDEEVEDLVGAEIFVF